MNLNELDAHAIDVLLSGIHGFPGGSAAARAAGGERTNNFSAPPGATAVRAMSDELASRVTRVDEMLRLLDYLPAEEPPPSLVQKTMQRIDEARVQARITAGTHLGVAAPGGSAGYERGIVRSPGDDDPIGA